MRALAILRLRIGTSGPSRDASWRSRRRSPIDQKYCQFVGEGTAWLREVPSQILRNGAVRFAQAYARFFRGLARRPTLHSKDRRQFTLERLDEDCP